MCTNLCFCAQQMHEVRAGQEVGARRQTRGAQARAPTRVGAPAVRNTPCAHGCGRRCAEEDRESSGFDLVAPPVADRPLCFQFLEIWNEDGVVAEPEEESGTD
jgi:hypothetical protein